MRTTDVLEPLTPRHRVVLRACTALRAKRVLDIGCGDGRFAAMIGGAFGADMLYGVELSRDAASNARRHGVHVVVYDLRHGVLPFADRIVDAVFAGDIIEHLADTDRFVAELHRVLAPGGYLIVSTPNAASWYNRAQLMLGFQPYGIPISDMAPIGMLFRSTQSQCQLPGHGYLHDSGRAGNGHVRFFTSKGLVSLLQFHRFQVERVLGTALIPTFGLGPVAAPLVKSLQGMFSRLPSLADEVVVVARAHTQGPASHRD